MAYFESGRQFDDLFDGYIHSGHSQQVRDPDLAFDQLVSDQ